MKKNTELKIINTIDLNNFVQIAKKLTEVKTQIKVLKASEKLFIDQLKNYMVDNKLDNFENFKIVEKNSSEVLPSEFYKYVSLIDFIKSVKVIKKEAKKYLGSAKLKEISIESEPTYDLKLSYIFDGVYNEIK